MLRTIRFILAGALVMTLTAAAVAQTSQPIANPIRRPSGASAVSTTQPAGPGVLETGQVVLALGAVLGLIVVLRFAIRKLSPGAMGKSGRGIQVIGRTSLAPKQQVVVLQVGRRLLVVGDTGQSLNTLCEITDPDEAALLVAQLQGKTPTASRGSFANAMDRAGEQFSPPVGSAPPGDPVLDSARTELNGLAQRVRVLARHLNQA